MSRNVINQSRTSTDSTNDLINTFFRLENGKDLNLVRFLDWARTWKNDEIWSVQYLVPKITNSIPLDMNVLEINEEMKNNSNRTIIREFHELEWRPKWLLLDRWSWNITNRELIWVTKIHKMKSEMEIYVFLEMENYICSWVKTSN